MYLYVSVCICMYHVCSCAAKFVSRISIDIYIQIQQNTYRYRQEIQTNTLYIQIHSDKYTLKPGFNCLFCFIWTVSVYIMSLSECRLYLYVSVCIGLYQYVSAKYQEFIRKQDVSVCIDYIFMYLHSITL